MTIDSSDPVADSLELQELSSALVEPAQEVDVLAPSAEGPSLLARAGSGLGNALVSSLLFSAGSALASQATLRVTAHRQPHPLPYQMAALLDHPVRLKYRNPAETLGLFGLAAGMTVLDLGCGAGTFTEEIARMVGPQGTVIGVDIQSPMVERTRARLLEKGLQDRCTLHHAGAYALPLGNLSVDVAIVVATLGEIPDRLHALLELYRVIKPGGRLAVSEELPHPSFMGARAVRALAEEAGFVFAGKTGGPLAYNIVFTRP